MLIIFLPWLPTVWIDCSNCPFIHLLTGVIVTDQVAPEVLPTVPLRKKMPKVRLNVTGQDVKHVPGTGACEITQTPMRTSRSHQQVPKIEPRPLMGKPAGSSKEKLFQCDDCGKQFSQNYNLKLHKLIHTEEKPHKCDVCGEGFRMKWRVALHRRTHTGEKPYACGACGFRANRKDNVRGHIQRMHEDSRNVKINMVSAQTPKNNCPQLPEQGKQTMKKEPIGLHCNMKDAFLKKKGLVIGCSIDSQQQDHCTCKYFQHYWENHCIGFIDSKQQDHCTCKYFQHYWENHRVAKRGRSRRRRRRRHRKKCQILKPSQIKKEEEC